MAPTKPLRSLELVVDNFGHIHIDGNYVQIKRFTWKNQNRVQIQAITYGATITSIKYPNKKGIIDDVVLGFDDMRGYLEHQEYYFGVIGRYANFIKNGMFSLGKKDYRLTKNMGVHHFNGGEKGFDKVIWEYYIAGNKVILSHVSQDNDEGYPGTLMVFVTYELTHNNEFKIEIKAFSNKSTICNISNSVHFNLAGHGTGAEEIGKHDLVINADCVTITNEDLLPTGEIKSVYNTMYDFQIPVKLATLLEKYNGINTNFCINRGVEQENCFIARLTHPDSGRILEIYSNQYGFQLETGDNFPLKLQVETPIKSKNPYLKSGLATFELLDEIYNRVHDVLIVDKSTKYNDLLRLIRDLQKKDSTLFRSSSSASVTREKIPQNNMIKRVKVSLDNLHNIQLTTLQIKYIEKIAEKISTVPDPRYLAELRDILESLLMKQKGRDDISVKTPTFEKHEDFANKELRGKKGARYTRHCAINLKTQNYPDCANHPNFPSCLLKPGTSYSHTIVYKFYVKTQTIGCTGYL